jgi:hypothetical protein
LPSTIRPHAAAAKHAITMSRLVPRIKFLLCFYGNCGAKFVKM